MKASSGKQTRPYTGKTERACQLPANKILYNIWAIQSLHCIRTNDLQQIDSQWWSSITYSNWLGSMPASHSRSTSSRKAWMKVLLQLVEEMSTEYIEGKAAAAVGTRWAAAEATATAADTETEAVPVRKSWNQTTDTWNATSHCVVTVSGEQRSSGPGPLITTALFLFEISSFPAFLIYIYLKL